MKCKAYDCGRSDKKNRGIHFYRFPKDKDTRREWVKLCVENESDVPFFKITSSCRLCSAHFPNGKRRADGAPIIPIRVAPEEGDECEWQEYVENGSDVPMRIDDFQNPEWHPESRLIGTADAEVNNIENEQLEPPISIEARLRIEIFQLRDQVKKLKRTVIRMKNRYAYKEAQRKKFQKTELNCPTAKVFNEDQLKLLSGKIKKVKNWSEATVMNSLQIRFACQGGYDKLIKRGYPFPSTRTLLRRVQDIHFNPGVLEDVFELMKFKVSGMSESEKDCGLVLDEMSIDELEEYCTTTKQYVGKTTLPLSDSLASKGLVLMIVGVSERWKQVVAFEFTGSSIPQPHLKDLVLRTIQKSEDIGLRVQFITSDSGAENQRLWKDLGLTTAHNKVTEDLTLPHPLDPNRKIEIIPDPVHVYKNCVNGWINNSTITLPQWYVEQKGLSSDVVDRDHLATLVRYERGNQLRMAHGLTERDVAFHLPVSSVEKMKVSNATKYCNRAVAADLRFVADETNRPEMLATACFIEDVTSWFEIINNRNQECALRKDDSKKLSETFKRLKEITKLIHDIRVGEQGRWKPWQSGLIMCTNAIVRLVQRLFQSGHTDIYTSRFVQDCLESLFSLIRSKQRRPTALQFRRNLKIIALSQYMAAVPNSSYAFDDQEHLVGMADFINQRRNNIDSAKIEGKNVTSDRNSEDCEEIEIDYNMIQEASIEMLDRSEINALYYVSGYILKSLGARRMSCRICLNMVMSSKGNPTDYQRFALHRAGASDRKIHLPTPKCFDFFKSMEVVYRNSMHYLTTTNENLEENLVKEMLVLPNVFHCESFKHKLIKRFVTFRLKSAQKKKQRKKKFDSRSMLF